MTREEAIDVLEQAWNTFRETLVGLTPEQAEAVKAIYQIGFMDGSAWAVGIAAAKAKRPK